MSLNRGQHLGAFGLAALAAVLFSAKAILAKLMYRHQIDPITLMSLRMGLALPVFALVAAVETRRARVQGRPLQSGDGWKLFALGFLGYYLSSFLDFWGLLYIAAALERLILFLTPTLVLGLSWLLLGKRIARAQWLALLLAYGGTVLVFVEHLRIDGGHVLLGSSLVFGAALSYALYLMYSGELVARIGSLRLVSYVMLISTALCLLHYGLVKDWTWPQQNLTVWQLSVINALLCTVAPVFLIMIAVARIGAANVSQLSMLGPVSLLFLGHWLLGEAITPTQLAGTAVVLAGIGWLTASQVRRHPG